MQSRKHSSGRRTVFRAFSLIELIVTVMIIGIVAAIAVPRLSQGAEQAAPEATGNDLAILRRQIELYAIEHGSVYPAYNGDGTNAAHTEAAFLSQMTAYSNIEGQTASARAAAFHFGPYVRQGLPVLKSGPKAGLNAVLVLTGGETLNYRGGAAVGWLYNDTTGAIEANTPAELRIWGVDGGVIDGGEAEAISGGGGP